MTASDDAFLSIVRRLRGAASDAESAFLREEAGEPNAPADHFAAWLHSTIHRSRVPAADSGHEPWGDSASADAASLYGCPSLAAERSFPAGMTCADLERELFVPIQLLWRMARRASGRPLDAAGRRHFTDAQAVEYAAKWIAARPPASEFEGLMREANRILVKLNPGLESCLLGSGLDFEVDLFFGAVYRRSDHCLRWFVQTRCLPKGAKADLDPIFQRSSDIQLAAETLFACSLDRKVQPLRWVLAPETARAALRHFGRSDLALDDDALHSLGRSLRVLGVDRGFVPAPRQLPSAARDLLSALGALPAPTRPCFAGSLPVSLFRS